VAISSAKAAPKETPAADRRTAGSDPCVTKGEATTGSCSVRCWCRPSPGHSQRDRSLSHRRLGTEPRYVRGPLGRGYRASATGPARPRAGSRTREKAPLRTGPDSCLQLDLECGRSAFLPSAKTIQGRGSRSLASPAKLSLGKGLAVGALPESLPEWVRAGCREEPLSSTRSSPRGCQNRHGLGRADAEFRNQERYHRRGEMRDFDRAPENQKLRLLKTSRFHQ
jgi:hypothetical protein